MSEDKQKQLRELIIKNPNADIKIFASEDCNCGEYSYQLAEIISVELELLTYHNEKFYNEDDMRDYLLDILANERLEKSEDELNKEVEDTMKHQKWEESICIYVG